MKVNCQVIANEQWGRVYTVKTDVAIAVYGLVCTGEEMLYIDVDIRQPLYTATIGKHPITFISSWPPSS